MIKKALSEKTSKGLLKITQHNSNQEKSVYFTTQKHQQAKSAPQTKLLKSPFLASKSAL